MCHVIFIPYGIKSAVDLLLTEMSCQKFKLIATKEGEPNKEIWIQGSVRLLPFGVVEYVFPKEYLDAVMTTLNFNNPPYLKRFAVQHKYVAILKYKFILHFLKKFLSAEKIPKDFNTKEGLLWLKDNVAILPIGVRMDDEVVEPVGYPMAGYKHEAI